MQVERGIEIAKKNTVNKRENSPAAVREITANENKSD